MDPRFNQRAVEALIAGVPADIRTSLGINKINDKRVFNRLSVSALTGLIELMKVTHTRTDAVRNIDKAKLDKGEYFAVDSIRVLHATGGGTTDAYINIAQYSPFASAQVTDADVTGDIIAIGAIAAAELKIYTSKQVIYEGCISDFLVNTSSQFVGSGDGVVELKKVCVISPEETIHQELRAGATAFLTNSIIHIDMIGVATKIG